MKTMQVVTIFLVLVGVLAALDAALANPWVDATNQCWILPTGGLGEIVLTAADETESVLLRRKRTGEHQRF